MLIFFLVLAIIIFGLQGFTLLLPYHPFTRALFGLRAKIPTWFLRGELPDLNEFVQSNGFSFFLIGFLCIVIPFIVVRMAQLIKNTPVKMVANQMTPKEFVTKGREYTREALLELIQSPEFMEHLKKKNGNPNNCVWQYREAHGEVHSTDEDIFSDEN